MKCRAILTCTSGGDDPPTGPKRGERCPNEATHHLGSTKLPPSLCWLHAKAICNPERRAKLSLVPLSPSELAEQFAHR